ncbi:MAG: DUF2807 domain-containing protein [Bacteroidota bacterium]
MRLLFSIIIACFTLFQAAGQENPVYLETPFKDLEVSGNIHLELILSDTQQLIFVSEGNQEALDIETKEEQLVLKTKSELSNDPSIDVKLHYVELQGLMVRKGGRVQSGDTLRAETFQLDVLTGGKVELWVCVDSISAKVNQGADIILYGTARSQYINAYSWGNYLGYDLEAVNSYVKAATGAQVKVHTLKLLDANATSKAFVGYRGEPELKKVKSSVGGEIISQSE